MINAAASEFYKWNNAAIAVELFVFKSRRCFLSKHACIKENTVVRFFNIPVSEVRYPTHNDLNRFIQIQGIVNSFTKKGYVEHAREFICKKCNSSFLLTGNYNKYFVLTPPLFCTKAQCNGQVCVKPNISFKKYAHSYQELYLEEIVAKNSKKPKNLIVTIENNLVDCCSLGDEVTVVGTVEIRQRVVPLGKTVLSNFTVRANNVRKTDSLVDSLNEEQRYLVNDEWNIMKNSDKGEFGARDFLLQSIMPELYCMYLPKLSIALALCSCVDNYKTNKARSQAHVLFVGEPGLAKSKLLQRAVELSTKGFFAGGYRVSKAGLTAGKHL